MGYDQPERSRSSGAVVAVFVAVLVAVVLGGLLVVGVGAFFLLARATEPLPRPTVVEQPARMVMEVEVPSEPGEAVAPKRVVTAGSSASGSKRTFDLNISRDGTVRVDGQPIDLEELRSRLEKLKAESGSLPRVRIVVAPECPREHLVSVLDACQGIAGEVTFHMSPSESAEPTTESQNPGE